MTFYISQRIESHMATKVPSPIISMIKRTALCPPMDSLRKQSTRVSSGEQTGSWVVYVTTWIVPFFKRSSLEVFHLGDPFWKDYYRAAQEIGLLTIAVK